MQQTVRQYRLGKIIGTGAAAQVYVAEDTLHGRTVALKILHDHLLNDHEQRQRFKQEAEWVTLLAHPNIPVVYEIGEIDGRPFMATELIDGETLRHYILPEMDFSQIIHAGLGVGRALEAAHREWIVHRDIKPENIMITRAGEVKVVDFGFAKLARPNTAGRNLTSPGFVVGTVHYLAPEQLLGAAPDPRTDLFSFGALLFEMITGAPPFDGPTNKDVFLKILREEPAPIRRTRVPPQLGDIIRKALKKDPEERWQTASEIVKALEEIGMEVVPKW